MPMDYSEIQEKPYNDSEFLGFDCINNVKPHKFIVDLMKFSFINGAEKALMARRSPRKSIEFDSGPCNDIEDRTRKAIKVCAKPRKALVRSSPNQVVDGIVDYKGEFVDVTKATNSPSGGYNEFPLNIVTFLAVLVIKFIGFQMNLFVKFFTISIWFSYFSIMLFLFPLQTLSRVRRYLRKKIMGMWFGFYFSVTSFICGRIKAQKCVLNLGIRCGWAAFWAMYVCMLLFGLFVSGFVIGGFTMKRLVEKPIQTTETLHFDYTKTSPAAFVPIMSPLDGGIVAAHSAGARAIPFNHKLQLTVSLSLPESDYNRKLGVFQVKVEFLSENGKISGSSSYPCMLKFKSQPIRVVETVFKSVPSLIAGYQSEVQMLNVKINDFTEGHDPTSSLRVILEQRAEYQSAGAGIPEIYSALVSLQSELPQFKKIIWCWRRSIFVWISLMSFMMELLVLLIFCRPMIIPRGRLTVTGAKKQAQKNNISW